MLAWVSGFGCDDTTEPETTTPPPAITDADATAPDAGAVIVEDAPREAGVRLDAFKKPVAPLPAFVPGTMRELVFEVRIAEKKALHVPVVRVFADTRLSERSNADLRLRWSPTRVVLPVTDGADEAFLEKFEGALAPSDPPTAHALEGDGWGAVAALPWPVTDDPHIASIAGGLQLAMSHVVLPTPPEGLSPGATWTIEREVQVFGIPAWERIEAEAKKIDGDQLELRAKVVFESADPIEPVTALGTQAMAVDGKASLHARYDLAAGLPIDMQLKGSLGLQSADGKTTPIKIELRADENYMAQPDPRVTLTGELTDGSLVVGKVPPGTKVWFNKGKRPVSEEGDFVIGFGRDAPPRALLAFSFEDGPPVRRILHVADRTFEPEAIDGLPEAFVHPDKETKRALGKSRKRIEKVRRKSSTVAFYRDGFIWPAKGRITSTYGRKRILNGEEKGPHWGVDIAGRVGSPVRAPAAGVVVFAEQDVPLSGNLVIIDHGHGVTSSFLHLQKIKVSVGDEVKQGQTIATLGNTGRSTGPHLDWRMNLGDTRIDPQLLVPPR